MMGGDERIRIEFLDKTKFRTLVDYYDYSEIETSAMFKYLETAYLDFEIQYLIDEEGKLLI